MGQGGRCPNKSRRSARPAKGFTKYAAVPFTVMVEKGSLVGTQIGPYQLTRVIGEGGMGSVFEAVHKALGRRVAIKVMKAVYAADPESLARLFNEARAVNLIDHPGLVQISEFGELPDGCAYLVMELLRGDTLTMRLRRSGGRLAEKSALAVASQLASVLAAAHEKEIVHRAPPNGQKLSRNRDLIESEKSPGKLGKIRGLRLVLDGSEQSRAFIGAHCA